jgi:hypothetical protein
MDLHEGARPEYCQDTCLSTHFSTKISILFRNYQQVVIWFLAQPWRSRRKQSQAWLSHL